MIAIADKICYIGGVCRGTADTVPEYTYPVPAENRV